jgi:arylsulfatase A-like enzyme
MTRQEFLLAAGAAALAAPAVGAAAAARQAERAGRRTNVLLILTDDQGYGDIHSHGNDVLDTPHMDALAASGARFDRFFVSPVCAPTRASLLTGRYHPRTGCFGVASGEETMRSDEVTIAEILQAAGYATACFGKWHNGAHYPHHPNGQGFEEYLGICCGHWNNYFDTEMEHNGEPTATKGYVNDVLTDAALAFIERHRERPWLAYLAYNTPHSPFQVPDRYFDKYKRRGLDDRLAAIYGMVESLDDCLGRLLARLDALRLADDTLVVFLTDNGPNGARANGGMRGQKGSVHEGGVRVPCFVRWPGRIAPGTVVKPIAAHIDLLPTLVELTGVPMLRTEPLDGVSLVPLLTGKAAGWPDRQLFTFFGASGAVRTPQYRLTVEGRRVGLYDMLADPDERRDIAGEKPEVARELKAAFDAKRADVNRGLAGRLPIPVGHEQRKLVEMPAVEGTWTGGLQLGGRHPNNNWLTAWTNLSATVTWDLDVVHAGPYEASVRTICPKEDVGSRLRLEAGGQAAEAVLDAPCEPNFVPSPDRVPRDEVYERRWGVLTLGTLRLPKGRVRLTLRALTRPGQAVMDLKSLRLRRTD